MTAEEKRERLLKRFLPAMGITVIYFVFISNIMVEQMNKAQDDYLKLSQRGISPALIQSTSNQVQQVSQEISKYQQKEEAYRAKIKKMALFVDKADGSTQSSTLLATILADNGIRVAQDEHREIDPKLLSPSLKEIKVLLLPDKPIMAQHLELIATYRNMYSALKQMNEKKLQAVPVVFNMSTIDDASGLNNGELKWELDLWI